MKLLSWNISYQAMKGIKDHSVKRSCKKIQSGGTECMKNVSKYIQQNGPYDFVALQEATNWHLIRSMTQELQIMNYVSYQYKRENGLVISDMVTFYNQKYIGEFYIESYMLNRGRPLTIIFFAHGLCLINIHAGHKEDIYKLDQHIMDTLNGKKGRIYTAIDVRRVKERLKTYQIILMGDMNNTLTNFFEIRFFTHPYFEMERSGGRRFYGKTKYPTCCDPYLKANMKKIKKPYDHIISTDGWVTINVHKVVNASDHLPVIGIIK